MFKFDIVAQAGSSRLGVVSTGRGTIKTPAFMPVGTLATVKSVAPWELEAVGSDIVLANTYHLMLRPGGELIKKAGGLHKWARWKKPILTDSGGYQVFSLGRISGGAKKMATATEDGVEFYSHLDGSKHFLDAQKSIEIQEQLGADIIMAFDECPPGSAKRHYVAQAVERTHRWLKVSKRAWTNRKEQALFGIVQGGTIKDLREKSARFVEKEDLPGNAIGGVSVGESRARVWKAVEWSVPYLNPHKPRYLMGVGEPSDIVEAVKRGCDMFDCVLPTRLGRHGVVWVTGGGEGSKRIVFPCGKTIMYKRVALTQHRYRADKKVLDPQCSCPACREGFSGSYVSHLLRENEILGLRLTTLHNLYFLENIMKTLRNSIGKS